MRLYLDIDGVLTCDPELFDFAHTDIIGGAYVDWNTAAARHLIDSFDEVVWATTWILPESHLDTIEALLGINDPLERVPLTWDNYRLTDTTCGKLPAVRAHYEANPAPFLWLDDLGGAQDRAWARSVGSKMITPKYDRGGIYTMLDQLVP